MIDKKELAVNFFWRSLQILSKHGIVFLIFFISATLLTPFNFGILTYFMAIISLLILFSDFGISNSASKYITEYKTKKKDELVNKVFFSASLFIIFAGMIISIIILIFGKYFFGKDYIYILLLLPYLFFVPLSSLLDGVYRGLKEFKKLSLISGIVGIFSLVISYFIIKNYGLIGAVISQNIIYVLTAIFLFIFLKEKTLSYDKKVLKDILNYSIVIGVIAIMYYLYTKTDILVLRYFGYVVEIGYYEILNQIFLLLFVPFIIFGQVLAPDITKLYTKRKYSEVKKNFEKILFFIIPLSIIITFFLSFILPFIIKIFFSQYFTSETLLMLQVLLLILPLKMFSTIINFGHTVPTGNAHLSMWTMIPMGILNVILDIVFIIQYGFIGVVYATVITHSIAIVSFISLYYMKLNNKLAKD